MLIGYMSKSRRTLLGCLWLAEGGTVFLLVTDVDWWISKPVVVSVDGVVMTVDSGLGHSTFVSSYQLRSLYWGGERHLVSVISSLRELQITTGCSLQSQSRGFPLMSIVFSFSNGVMTLISSVAKRLSLKSKEINSFWRANKPTGSVESRFPFKSRNFRCFSLENRLTSSTCNWLWLRLRVLSPKRESNMLAGSDVSWLYSRLSSGSRSAPVLLNMFSCKWVRFLWLQSTNSL